MYVYSRKKVCRNRKNQKTENFFLDLMVERRQRRIRDECSLEASQLLQARHDVAGSREPLGTDFDHLDRTGGIVQATNLGKIDKLKII